MVKESHPGRLTLLTVFWSVAFLITSSGMAFYAHMRGLAFPLLSYDTTEHIEAIEYFFKQGHYWPDFRMPSIGILYGVFYIFFQKRDISIVLVSIIFLITIMASAITSIRYGYSYTRKVWVAHGIGLIWATAPIALYWYWLVQDPLMAALNVIAVIALLRHRYILAGLMITGLFFLRPIAAISLIVVFIYILLTHKSLREKLRALVFTLLPLVVIESSWVVRNYLRYGEFRPFWGTGTLTHATCGPLSSYMVLYRHLGIGGADSEDASIFIGTSEENPEYFTRFFPNGYFSKNDELLIKQYLVIAKMANQHTDDSSRCEIDKMLEAHTRRILSEVRIHWLRRRIATLTKALFGIVIKESGSFNSSWLSVIVRVPLYAWTSISFLSAFLFSTLLAILCLTMKKLELTHFLWYSFGALGSLSYFLIGFIEQRYLIQYYPTLSIGALLMAATFFAKNKK